MASSMEPISEEDLLSDLSRDKALLILKVNRLEDTVVTLMSKHTRNVDTIKVQAEEIKDLSEAVKFLECSLRSSQAKVTLLEESLVLGRRIDKLHPPSQAACSTAVTECGCASSSPDIMKSLELLPALVSRMEAALGDVTSGPLLKPKKVPSERTEEELSEFREQVSTLKLRLSVEPTYALVHPCPGPGLLDLCGVEPTKHCRNTYHIPKVAHERALKSCRSYTAYATAVLHDLFKPSVTMFCTCTGYSKGRAADGNDRASLPNEAIAVFFDHCCSVGSVTYEVKESDESMKQRLQRSINVYLKAHRKKKDLVPTVAPQSERKAAATSMYLISESD